MIEKKYNAYINAEVVTGRSYCCRLSVLMFEAGGIISLKKLSEQEICRHRPPDAFSLIIKYK